MINDDLIRQYPDLQPTAEELPGDLARLAAIIDNFLPGQGVKVTLNIADEFRGTYIYCHNMDSLYREARNRWIKEQYDHGVKVPDLARQVTLSERRVWAILGKEPVDDRQQRLF